MIGGHESFLFNEDEDVYKRQDMWKEMLKEYEEIVYIPLSSALSGSCMTAEAMANEDEFAGKAVSYTHLFGICRNASGRFGGVRHFPCRGSGAGKVCLLYTSRCV